MDFDYQSLNISLPSLIFSFMQNTLCISASHPSSSMFNSNYVVLENLPNGDSDHRMLKLSNWNLESWISGCSAVEAMGVVRPKTGQKCQSIVAIGVQLPIGDHDADDHISGATTVRLQCGISRNNSPS